MLHIVIPFLFFGLVLFLVMVWRAPDRPTNILDDETLQPKLAARGLDPEAAQSQSRRAKVK